MTLAYDAKRVTRDVDARFMPHGIVLAEARRVAEDPCVATAGQLWINRLGWSAAGAYHGPEVAAVGVDVHGSGRDVVNRTAGARSGWRVSQADLPADLVHCLHDRVCLIQREQWAL